MTDASKRQIIVVDTETTGLSLMRHVVVEVSWWNLDTDEHDTFVPLHHVNDALAHADIDALRINRYIDRLAKAEQDWNGAAAGRLSEQLHGNTLAGSNPSFDAGFLGRMLADYGEREVLEVPTWHHRLLDLANYAAPLLGFKGHELPGLSTVCERLGVVNEAPHTAAGDVEATAKCFRALFDMVASGKAAQA